MSNLEGEGMRFALRFEPIQEELEFDESVVIPCLEAIRRLTADRRSLRYPSDLSDAEWLLVAPMIPPARRGGRRRSVNVREVLNGIVYMLSTGCQWKAMPKDLPPKSTAHFYFTLWD